MEFVEEELPYYAQAHVDADEGSRVEYVDLGLQIRSVVVGESRSYVPGFLVPYVEEGVMETLKAALRAEGPGELRLLRGASGFFMCIVRP